MEKPGVLLEDHKRLDASSQFQDFDGSFFELGGMESLQKWVAEGCPGATEIPEDVRIGPPVVRPSKIVCVGKNYLDHALEFGEGVPTEPVLFMKASSCWSGPFDDVINPPEAEKLDYEVELAVVIGKKCSHVPEDQSLDHVAGYAVFCDYSERSYQKDRGGQWTKGKSYDSFGPLGPWLVPAAEVADPQGLRLWCKVNGEFRQSSWTKDMMFGVRHLISYISRFMTLLPGDVIATGTPSGVAMGMNPPQYLKPGDCVEVGIEGLGEMRQRVIAYSAGD
jgi:2,4-didehydro-3-deoxy-L-rhamnonate hydrolase